MEATEKEDLTDRQRQLYEFIRKYHKKHSMAPTLNEMAIHMKVITCGVRSHLIALERQGLITWNRGVHRGVRLSIIVKRSYVMLKPGRTFTVGSIAVACQGIEDNGSVKVEVIHPDTEELVS